MAWLYSKLDLSARHETQKVDSLRVGKSMGNLKIIELLSKVYQIICKWILHQA